MLFTCAVHVFMPCHDPWCEGEAITPQTLKPSSWSFCESFAELFNAIMQLTGAMHGKKRVASTACDMCAPLL